MNHAPILYISGWGTNDQIWNGIRGRLPQRENLGLSWAELLTEPQAVARALGSRPEPWLLVGWSLGALLALRVALDFPHRLAGLVLISGTARMCAEEGYPGADPRALRAMRVRLPRDPARVLNDFATLCAAPEGGEAVREDFLAQAETFSTEALALGLESLAMLDLREQAEQIALPTLLIHGAQDGVIPFGSAQALAARIPGARLEILASHGHALPLTAAAEVAQLIRSFSA